MQTGEHCSGAFCRSGCPPQPRQRVLVGWETDVPRSALLAELGSCRGTHTPARCMSPTGMQAHRMWMPRTGGGLGGLTLSSLMSAPDQKSLPTPNGFSLTLHQGGVWSCRRQRRGHLWRSAILPVNSGARQRRILGTSGASLSLCAVLSGRTQVQRLRARVGLISTLSTIFPRHRHGFHSVGSRYGPMDRWDRADASMVRPRR